MKPMITQEGNSVNLDLTKPMLAWGGVFGLLALVFQSWTLFWVAVAPILLLLGFVSLFFLFGVLAMTFAYMSGESIKVTNHRKGTVKYVQRRR